ncbi:MAG: FAD-dependent oxidoreductase [Saprospiraceae bacterium]|nr:FAD-dependent oxidoreductase [Saprospiraceae bacterium]
MYDILIVGAGTAGMACAITAAQNGATVGVIEKADHIGGALHWSGGHMSAGGTRRQKAQGIEDSPIKHYEDIVALNEGTGDLDLIRLATEEAPHTIDWLEDLGFEFAPECPRIIYGHIPYNTARTHYGVDKALSIFKVLKPLWDEQVEKGQIDCYLEHSMVGLRIQGEGSKQVVAKNREEERVLEAPFVVLTTGGYGSDPTYFAEKHPGVPLLSSTYPTATGDGHRVVEDAGGDFEFAQYHLPSLGGVALSPGRCNFNEAWAMVLTSIYRQPREVYVNAEGRRFMAEDESNADTRERIVTQQTDWKFWLIFDEAALQERGENGMENPIMIGWDTARIKAAAAEERFLWRANDLQGLAEKCGLPADTLADTIRDFNQKVQAKVDVDFGRAYLENPVLEPPFYALEVQASVLVTFGGMKVNDRLQLLDRQGEPMPGLYAAGELLGLGATSGKAFCSGMAITPALSFGRLLGRNLARQIQSI